MLLRLFCAKHPRNKPRCNVYWTRCCPADALNWCVSNGYIRPEQVLGAMSHPATTGGSSVPYFLREKRLEDLKLNDPVRHRTEWLDAAYENMSKTTTALLEKSRSF